MRYLLLILLASVAIVACGNSDAPDCTSPEAANALRDYLLDPAEYGMPADPQIQRFLSAASLALGNFRTTGQDPGLHSSQCVATVHLKKDETDITIDVSFSDHLPGDKMHVVDANLTALRDRIHLVAR